MAKEDQVVAVSAAALQAMINEAVAGKMAQVKADIVDPLERRLAAANELNTAPIEESRQDCQSPTTFSNFTARILKSRGFPKGRIVDLENYQYPPEAEMYVRDGGHVPDDTPIKDAKTGAYDKAYMKWRAENYWIKDIREWNGKPFTSYLLRTEAEKRRAAEAAE